MIMNCSRDETDRRDSPLPQGSCRISIIITEPSPQKRDSQIAAVRRLADGYSVALFFENTRSL
jgi:hypothetical protein